MSEVTYIDGQGVAPGDRIRLVEMPAWSDPDPIEAGAIGTVERVNDLRPHMGVQIAMRWDNGRSLALTCPPDTFELEDGERRCGWCGESFNLADGGSDFDPEAGGPVCPTHEED